MVNKFHSLHGIFGCPSTIYFKYYSFPIMSWYICQKSVVHKYKDLFLESWFFHHSICPSVSQCHIVLITVSFKIGKYESSNFVLLFQDRFVILGSLQFCMNFATSLSISSKTSWDFDRDYTASTNQVGEYYPLDNIKSFDPWT